MEAPDNPVDQVDFDNQTSDVSSLDDCSTSLEDEEIRQFRLLCSIIEDEEDFIPSYGIIFKYLNKLDEQINVKMEDTSTSILNAYCSNLTKKYKIFTDSVKVWNKKHLKRKIKGDRQKKKRRNTSNTTMKMKHESDSDSDDNRKKKKRKNH